MKTQADKLIKLANSSYIKNNCTLKVVSVTSGKGGVGKSTMALSIAKELAKNGNKVILLDADIGLANLHVMLRKKPKYRWQDYLDLKCDINNLLIGCENNLKLIAGRSGEYGVFSKYIERFPLFVEELCKSIECDYLIIDTGAGINRNVTDILQISNEIIAVTTPNESALTDLYAMLKVVSKIDNKAHIIMNKLSDENRARKIVKSVDNLIQKHCKNYSFRVNYMCNVPPSVGEISKVGLSEGIERWL